MKKFCCYWRLAKGVHFIAWFGIVVGLALFGTVMMMKSEDAKNGFGKSDVSMMIWSRASLLYALLHVMLLFDIIKKKTLFIKVWLIFKLLLIIAWNLSVMREGFYNPIVTIICFPFSAIMIYFWICVLHYYKQEHYPLSINDIIDRQQYA